MKITKLHLLPVLLLLAAVKLDIVASQINWTQFESLKGQFTTSTCPPIVTDTETSTTEPEQPTDTGTTTDSDYTSTDPTSSLSSTAPRSIDSDFDSLPVNSIGRNTELNTINDIDSARNQQTIRIRQRLPARRGSQRRRRRTNRKRPSAEKRRRRNRQNSKDRRRRRRRGQRRGQRTGSRQEIRRVFVRRHYSRRSQGESTAKPEQSQ